ncbi:sigma-70 family RNA polymerase sigma factor [Bradyrhizobium manausense]|nr:sigma-70 family RNA polymerase sigma factor [Bradyrhizobium manausense]
MSNVSRAVDRGGLLNALICNRRRLVSIAARILASEELAEDVVQDAMLKACDLAGTDPNCPMSFACRMVRNLAIDRARRRRWELQHALPSDGLDAVEAPIADAQCALEGCEALRAVLAALDELPERTRRVFMAHRLDGVPQKTLAAESGVSPTLVNFMIRDAQRHCLARLEAHEHGHAAGATGQVREAA